MADAMDLVQQRVEERQRHIKCCPCQNARRVRVLCIECEAPIPPARRRAIQVCSFALPVRKSQS